MKVVSVNIGLPRQVAWKGMIVSTGIFKEPVHRTVEVKTLNLEGDRQADLSVHGGPDKAVYAYPVEHYAHWQAELPDMALSWGMFGENITIEGLMEDTVNIGDQLQIGSVVLMVTQPRVPCYKLALRFDRDDMTKRFLRSGRSGFYLSVLQEGNLSAGDNVELLRRDPRRVTVADISRLYLGQTKEPDLLRRSIRLDALPEGWKAALLEKARKATQGKLIQGGASPIDPSHTGV